MARSIIAGDWETFFAEKEHPFWLNYERGGGGTLLKAAKRENSFIKSLSILIEGDIMPHSNILMYTTEDGITKIEVAFDHDTVWLSIDQMAELFQRDKSVIGKHVRNIFKEGELAKEAVWAKFAYTASDGKTYQVDFYNLDVIISVGYRVKSLRGTQFRI